jgi:hypothetical protein
VATAPLRAGHISLRRFLALVLPGALGALLLVPAIVLGWVSVTIAAARPIAISASHGTARSLVLGTSTDQAVTGTSLPGEGARAAAVVNVTSTELDDLCLLPRFELPLLGRVIGLRLSTSDPVHLGRITLAASEGAAAGLDLPETVVGTASLGGSQVPGVGTGGFVVRSSGGEVDFDGLDMPTLGLVLNDGLRLDTLSLRAGVGDQHC